MKKWEALEMVKEMAQYYIASLPDSQKEVAMMVALIAVGDVIANLKEIEKGE